MLVPVSAEQKDCWFDDAWLFTLVSLVCKMHTTSVGPISAMHLDYPELFVSMLVCWSYCQSYEFNVVCLQGNSPTKLVMSNKYNNMRPLCVLFLASRPHNLLDTLRSSVGLSFTIKEPIFESDSSASRSIRLRSSWQVGMS